MSSKHAPIFVKRVNLDSAIETLRDEIEPYMDGKGVTLTIKLGAETRRGIQNRLAQIWKGEIAEFMHEDNFERQWGEMKLKHLFPLKEVMPEFQNEAHAELDLTQSLAKILKTRRGFADWEDYQILCYAANVAIRSKDLPLMLFARWLDRLQRVYGEQGLRLEARNSNSIALLKDSERNKLNDANRRAA